MRRRAFTLVEVLAALALILVLSGSLFGYVWGLLDKRDRLVEVARQQAATAVFFEQIERDLATTFAVDGAGRAGVRGDGAFITIRCRGVADRAGGDAMDLGDLVGSEVRVSSGKLQARRLGKADGNFETVFEGVERLQLRYFDGREWLDRFDSASAGSLPVAVEAAVWFGESTSDEGDSVPGRAPDRVRVITVPDGPTTAWKGGA